MEKYTPFSLKGCGYVQDLELSDREASISIEVIPMPPNRSSSTVTLDCTILPALQEKIRQLNLRHHFTSGVMVKFDAFFYCFAACYVADDFNPPRDIIVLKGELKAIQAWKHDPTGLHPLR